MNPLSTSRNKYHQNVKDSSIMTPSKVAQFLYYLVHAPIIESDRFINKVHQSPVVFDPCCGTGNLLKPFFDNSFCVHGIDIVNYVDRDKKIIFNRKNFLEWNGLWSSGVSIKNNVALVICNPPFNTYSDNKKWMKENKKGKALLPELFADKVFKLFDKDVPLILFSPMGLRLNQRKKSNRWRKMRDEWPQISSIVSLPLDIFPDVEFHNEILIFNIDGLNPHYMLPEEYV